MIGVFNYCYRMCCGNERGSELHRFSRRFMYLWFLSEVEVLSVFILYGLCTCNQMQQFHFVLIILNILVSLFRWMLHTFLCIFICSAMINKWFFCLWLWFRRDDEDIHCYGNALSLTSSGPLIHHIYNLLNGIVLDTKMILCHKYASYLLITKTIVFIILSAIERDKLHLFSLLFGKISLFVHVIYSSVGVLSSHNIVK